MVKIFAAAAVVAGLASMSAAQAGTISSSLGSMTAISAAGATTSPFPLGNFGTAGTSGLVSTSTIQIANGGTISFVPDASMPQAGVYFGSTTNITSSPYNGTGLTPANYLVAEPNDPVTINFGTVSRNSFSLLWGSVDTYNSLEVDLLNTNGVVIGSTTVTGTNVAAAVNQGTGGTAFQANGSTSAFVTLNSNVAFNQVVARSTTAAFEFNPSVQVPEPASMALLGVGLAGIGLVRRKKAVPSA